MNDKNSKILQDSLSRCVEDKDFFRIFYVLFLETAQEIKEKFKDTDFERQSQMMEDSLNVILLMDEPGWESNQTLIDIAESHKKMSVKSEFYQYWQISLLAAVAECDPQYDETILRAWREKLEKGIEFMMTH